MKYEFIHHRIDDWNFEEKALINQTIHLALQVKPANTLEVLAKHIYDITQVKYILISKAHTEDLSELSSLLFMANGTVLDNAVYSTIGAPCQNALSHSICYYPLGIQQEFPEALILQHLGVHSYMGMALKDLNQKNIGIITLLDEKPIKNPGLVEHLLTIVSPLLEEKIMRLNGNKDLL
ncbi:hypothetical protein [Adhaeribacter pallidiroseus]|uniref:GAF domain-containing protein n=1 Tax=Adhaeribacter pallidiroseus TaxID=2072847 RepID=A0A369QFX7_9BACT|nr:hypothetical protein [Adhaeribacter pallidiroseus]RDC62455.1 hypothetical protein AHMF7616_01049 [Adhaeribacter pallidiroseus]